MKKRNFNKAGRVKAALKILRQYNDYVMFPLSEDALNDPLLVQYFETPLDNAIEATVEKILAAAAIKTVYDNPNIFKSKREACAKKNAQEIKEAMRIAKLEYRVRVKKDTLNVLDYEERKAAIPLIRKAARIKKLKKIGKYLTIRAFASAVGGYVADTVVWAGRLVWKVIPDSVRKPLVKAAKEVKEEALKTINKCTDYLKNTQVGKAVKRVAEKAKPYVNKAVQKIKTVGRKLRDKLVSFCVNN